MYGVRIVISGDTNALQSPCLIVMNHRTRFDWLFLWCYLIRKGNLNRGKIILKKQLKHVFGFGKYCSQYVDNHIFVESKNCIRYFYLYSVSLQHSHQFLLCCLGLFCHMYIVIHCHSVQIFMVIVSNDVHI